MLSTRHYDRARAVRYAKKWAFARNPAFYDFSALGGDCTNFISQCIYAGTCRMNYTPTFGWYFNSANDRAPAWSGVAELYRFLTGNQSEGPFAEKVDAAVLEPGDVIQLGDGTGRFYHSLLVTGFARGTPLISTHTFDALDRPLSSYDYQAARYLHIQGVRYPAGSTPVCPDYMN